MCMQNIGGSAPPEFVPKILLSKSYMCRYQVSAGRANVIQYAINGL